MRGFLVMALACAIALGAVGCGNQMMRQPSFSPIASPRAAPPIGAVRVDAALTPTDGRPVASLDTGNSPKGSSEMSQMTITEPTLPPANLSDNARNEATPKSVDALKNPLTGGKYLINCGRTLFLNRCVQCHNASGYGYGPVGAYLLPHPPDLASSLVQKRSDGAFFWHITMGQGKMPAFRTWTTPYQRWELTAYVRSLRGASPKVRRSDTLTAPYPVYGEAGFEEGHLTTPYKVLPADPEIRKNIRATHFWQSRNGGWKSAP